MKAPAVVDSDNIPEAWSQTYKPFKETKMKDKYEAFMTTYTRSQEEIQ